MAGSTFVLVTALLALSSPEDQMRRAAQTNEHQQQSEDEQDHTWNSAEPYVSANKLIVLTPRTFLHDDFPHDVSTCMHYCPHRTQCNISG
jgi:hypothetical protein